jgi:hypothetical protein
MPTTSTSRSRGYNRDEYGIVDIKTSMYRYSDEPYILVKGAEPVFYVNLVKKLGWSSVVAMRPRNLFAMPDEEN